MEKGFILLKESESDILRPKGVKAKTLEEALKRGPMIRPRGGIDARLAEEDRMRHRQAIMARLTLRNQKREITRKYL